jgi:hypothetical protein
MLERLAVAVAASVLLIQDPPQQQPQPQAKTGRPSQAEIDKAIDNGAEYLKKQQNQDGSWPMGPEDIALHAFKNHMGPQVIGHTAINLLALLVADVNPDDPCIARGFKFLADKKKEFGHTYNCGITLMAIEMHAEKRMKKESAKPGFKRDKVAAFHKLPKEEQTLAEELARRLVLGQLEDGSWTYHAKEGDVQTGTGIHKIMINPTPDQQQPPQQQPGRPPGLPQPGGQGVPPGLPPPGGQGVPPGLPQPGQQPQPGGGLPPGLPQPGGQPGQGQLPPGLPGMEPPNIGGDLSNTQYALLGLRSAAELGIKFSQDVWLKAAKCMIDRQEKSGTKVKPFDIPAVTDEMWDGKKGPAIPKSTKTSSIRNEFEARGWGYSASMSRPQSYGAMTCIGVASLVMCKYYLRGHKDFKGELLDKINRGIEDGCAWLATNFNVADNAKWQDPHVPYKNTAPKIDGYNMYGIERAGVLAGVDCFGEHDWYGLGARVLIDRQQSDGSWSSEMFYEPKATISTVFAILFLKRATEPVIETGADPAKKPAEKK